MPAQTFTPAEQALNAIWTHLRQGDWGNAERVLNEYASDLTPACTCGAVPVHQQGCDNT